MSISLMFRAEKLSAITAKKNQIQSLITDRIGVFYRFALALLGGYLLSAMVALLVVLLLKPIVSGVILTTIFAFVAHIVSFTLVYLCRCTIYASLMVLNPSALLYVCSQMIPK